MNTHHSFKPGERVKVYSGGKLEGTATIKAVLPAGSDYYRVHFDGDDPGDYHKRWVAPEWQTSSFSPDAPEADAISGLQYGNARRRHDVRRSIAGAALLLLAAFPSYADAAARHRTAPISSITVKVVSHADYIRGQKGPLAHAPWRILRSDADSCTAWVDTTVSDVSGAEVGALRACRKVIDATVDAAADRSGA